MAGLLEVRRRVPVRRVVAAADLPAREAHAQVHPRAAPRLLRIPRRRADEAAARAPRSSPGGCRPSPLATIARRAGCASANAVVGRPLEHPVGTALEPARPGRRSRGVSKSGTNGFRSRTGVPSRRSIPSTVTAVGLDRDDRGRARARSDSGGAASGWRTSHAAGRRGRGRPSSPQPSDLVQVCDHPQVREARRGRRGNRDAARRLDRRLAARVGDRLQRHAVEAVWADTT